MKRPLITLFTILSLSAPVFAADWLHLPAKGKANGKRVVFVSGDEEYRTEESFPMLAKILSQKHGYDCTVLFAINPDGGFVDPNFQKNIPGLAALEKADLMVIGTRFRQLPDEQLAPIAAFLNAGKPVIGLRTATHAFTGGAKTGEFKWSEFGLKILGEKWVNHHGGHGSQGTRGIVEAANAKHPLFNGVGEIFGPTDVYTVSNLDLKTATLLLRGAVTETLDPKSPAIAGKKNEPMMPLAWLREYTAPNGTSKGAAFCTTLGASVDFADEDLRRLVVNAAFALTKQPVPAKADVAYVDAFEPTFYKGQGSAHYKTRNLKPDDYALGKSPATGLEGGAKKETPKAEEQPPHAPNAEPLPATSARAQAVAPPAKGERIVFIGNGLAERDVYYSRMETELHLRYPANELFVRNMGRPGDTAGFRPHPARKSQWAFPGAEKFHPALQQHNGKGFFSTPDQWLTHLKADTVVAFFGYNESYDGPEGVANYEAELDAFAAHTLSKAYNGKAAPRLVLVSPIAFENLSAKRDLPTGEKENANLALYSAAMERVAKKRGITFIDLFTPTKALYAKAAQPFTINGFAPTEAAYSQLGAMLATGMFGHQSITSKADAKTVNAAVKQRDWFWNNDYNLINGVHTHGQRYKPYGPQNYPDEVKKTRELMALRDTLIHNLAAGKTTSLAVDDSKTHKLPPVPTNFAPSEKNGTPNFIPGNKTGDTFTMAPGYKVELFASESEFPLLANPVQMSFDNKGRLWVAVMPTYPHYRPGDAMPNDKLVIYEDTNNDGKADKETIFADHLQLPIGFEIAPEGVYLSQEPNLCLLVDDNHDDKADRMEIIMHGFDTHDTHHAISAYCADASGAFYLLEGRFLHSQVETAYGPRRVNDGGVWRFDPKNHRLERYSQADVSNPWGMSFDYWEQAYISDASPGENWWGLPISAKMPYGVEIPKAGQFVPKRSRPTSGAEFVSSRHFPDEQQGDFMICNSIGFLGISFARPMEDGSGFVGTAMGDLLSSKDGNFRPVDLEFAPDGSLYVIDWHNPLIGHMQHNARDPHRDHDHGRIYRITYPARPLVKPTKIAGASVAELLEALKTPEYRTRYRARRELRGHPASEVIPAVKAWAVSLDKNDAQYEHHLCEAMWATWAQNKPDADLIKQLLGAKAHQARAAAASVLRFNGHQIPDSIALLKKAANDAHGRVRLEAIVAASWLDNADGVNIIAEALRHPLDRWMGPVTSQIVKSTLNDDIAALKLPLADNETASDIFSGKKKIAAAPKSDEDKSFGPTRKLTPDEEKTYKLGREIYLRDAHCTTCHQPNGEGMPNVYPTLAKTEWIGDDELFTKIVLKGLWGAIEVKGVKFDPTKGVPPMTPFGGLLNDNELAAVMSYVRQSFGNDGAFISPETVKKVREATKERLNFYMVDELLKEHPLKK